MQFIDVLDVPVIMQRRSLSFRQQRYLRFSSPAESWDCWVPGRDSAENCGGSAFFVPVGDADNMVDVPVLCMLGVLVQTVQFSDVDADVPVVVHDSCL